MATNLISEGWYRRKEAARYLAQIGYPIAPQTLANLASNNNAGGGPPFTRQRWNSILYFRDDLEAWAEARKQKVT